MANQQDHHYASGGSNTCAEAHILDKGGFESVYAKPGTPSPAVDAWAVQSASPVRVAKRPKGRATVKPNARTTCLSQSTMQK